MIRSKKPWGVLTGVRPTKKARKLLQEGVDDLPKVLKKDYKLSKKKIKILLEILNNQTCFKYDSGAIDFYVNIPICPTRCAYCSFISSELNAVKDVLTKYLETLKMEIVASKHIIKENNFKVRSVYVGGGTPSVLTAEQLECVLEQLDFGFKNIEFTVECGRPDTITEDKLKVLKKFGVTRISINPQTFCEKTLNHIGRKHTVNQIFEAVKLAKKYKFFLNMDLIAGLEGENLKTFKNSLKQTLLLNPDNITVHTLSIKKGSCLQNKKIKNSQVEKMVNYGYKTLTKLGYRPYYLYRQKNQLGNLENIGYSKPNALCVFNVDSMEETTSIMACGANAISKFVDFKNNKIERVANMKFLNDYINNIEIETNKKQNLFKNK